MSNSKPPDPLGVAARTRPGSFQLPKLAKTLQVREALGRACLRSKAPPWKQRISGLCAASCVLVCLCTYMIIQKHIYIYAYSHKHSFIYITRLGSIFISMSISACLSVHVVYMNMPRRELLADVAFFLLRLRVPYLFISGFIQPSQNRKPHLLGGQQTQLLEAGVFRHSGFWGSSRLGKWQV